jgi:hypothetical protein
MAESSLISLQPSKPTKIRQFARFSLREVTGIILQARRQMPKLAFSMQLVTQNAAAHKLLPFED